MLNLLEIVFQTLNFVYTVSVCGCYAFLTCVFDDVAYTGVFNATGVREKKPPKLIIMVLSMVL